MYRAYEADYCDNEATYEFFNMHRGFKRSLVCKKHAEEFNTIFKSNNWCIVLKEIGKEKRI